LQGQLQKISIAKGLKFIEINNKGRMPQKSIYSSSEFDKNISMVKLTIY
jgi:hypothetical protein